MKNEEAKRKAEDGIKSIAWVIYHHFKKHHDMLNW